MVDKAYIAVWRISQGEDRSIGKRMEMTERINRLGEQKKRKIGEFR